MVDGLAFINVLVLSELLKLIEVVIKYASRFKTFLVGFRRYFMLLVDGNV